MKLLTVIMPVYNASAYVSKAIESILNQTFVDFDLWIIDDGSTDDSVNIIKKYSSDPRVSLLINNTNQGKITVVIEAIVQLTSKYFTVHDADDVSHPERFQKQIHLLESSKIVMCGTSYDSIDAKGNSISIQIQPTEIDDIRKNIYSLAQFHGPTMIIRTDILSEVGGFYRIMKMGEDIDFSMRVVEKFDATNTTDVLYHYRINPDSMTKSSSYDLLGKLIDRKLIYTFADERKKTGIDSLMSKDFLQIQKYRDEVKSDYLAHISIHVENYVSYLLHYHLTTNALVFVIKTITKHPFKFGLYRILFFILRKRLFSI